MTVPYLPLNTANGDLVFVLAFLPLAMWLVALTRVPDWLAPPLDWLGAFSLPLYCVHLTVLVAVSTLGLGWRWVPVGVAASCAVAYLFHRLVSFRGKPRVVKGPAPTA
jgi:peptidoglycan/LPS O-acetylase OafA/YrhL